MSLFSLYQPLSDSTNSTSSHLHSSKALPNQKFLYHFNDGNLIRTLQNPPQDSYAPRSASPPTSLIPQSNNTTGYTQSGPLFRSKSRALHKALSKHFPSHDIQLSYPTGPHHLQPTDIPGYIPTSADPAADAETEAFGWWRRKDIPTKDVTGKDVTEIVYTGLHGGLSTIATTIRESGPFDGVIGFSQGACAAAIVASLLDSTHSSSRIHAFSSLHHHRPSHPSFSSLSDDNPVVPFSPLPQQSLKFAIIYSGFLAPGNRYAAFYDPPILTPTLHFLGQLDGVVEEGRSRALVEKCERAKVVVHPGGHFLPSQRPWLDAVCGFIKECVVQAEGEGRMDGTRKSEVEERVEDMDVPF